MVSTLAFRLSPTVSHRGQSWDYSYWLFILIMSIKMFPLGYISFKNLLKKIALQLFPEYILKFWFNMQMTE